MDAGGGASCLRGGHVLKVGVLGVSGRMGVAITSLAERREDCDVVAGWSRSSTKAWPDIKSARDVFKRSDVVIDVSSADLLEVHLFEAAQTKKPLVVCTTGFKGSIAPLFAPYQDKVPLLYASNTSLGIFVVRKALELMSLYLRQGFDVAILDRHHVHKKDAPSGTALSMAETISDAQGNSSIQDIQMASFRTGEILGECAVSFTSPHERISVSHEAFDRGVFAEGALRATFFLSQQKPGLYMMDDVYCVL